VKICARCLTKRRNIEFSTDRSKLSGMQSYCKPCKAISDRKRLYGLEDDEFKALLTHQNNKCAVCQEQFVTTPHVDHSHDTGRVRGLLCLKCNRGVGLMGDDVEASMRAALYLYTAERGTR
jgi:hypothetical protein